jgi:hypothetical protein
MAATNKCLAQSNKLCTRRNGTKNGKFTGAWVGAAGYFMTIGT